MMTTGANRACAIFRLYVLPLPLFAVMWRLWLHKTGNAWFTSCVMLLPLVYGYLAPGIAANVLGKWRFTGPLRWGNILVHHGFIYASNMSLLLFIAFGGLRPGEAPGCAHTVSVVLCAAALHGYVMWLNDLQTLRAGLVQIGGVLARPGASPEEIAARYAPSCFGLLGLTYALAVMLAWREMIVLAHHTLPTFAWVFASGMTLMLLLPSLAFGLSERHASKPSREP